MTDPIATIREALDILDDFLSLDGSIYAGPDPKKFREAVGTIVAELTTLRANSLDLSKLPDGWCLYKLEQWRGKKPIFWLSLVRMGPVGGPYPSGTGPTPQAALDAAIERAKSQPTNGSSDG